MRRLILAAAAGLLAGPAFAQSFDPTAQRLEMERLRAQTQANADFAAAYRADAGVAAQQLRATARNDGGVAAAVAADAQVRAQAERERDARRRAAEDAAAELERRLREAAPPR